MIQKLQESLQELQQTLAPDLPEFSVQEEEELSKILQYMSNILKENPNESYYSFLFDLIEEMLMVSFWKKEHQNWEHCLSAEITAIEQFQKIKKWLGVCTNGRIFDILTDESFEIRFIRR